MNFDVLFFSGHELGVFCLHRFAFFQYRLFQIDILVKETECHSPSSLNQTFFVCFSKKNPPLMMIFSIKLTIYKVKWYHTVEIKNGLSPNVETEDAMPPDLPTKI